MVEGRVQFGMGVFMGIAGLMGVWENRCRVLAMGTYLDRRSVCVCVEVGGWCRGGGRLHMLIKCAHWILA